MFRQSTLASFLSRKTPISLKCSRILTPNSHLHSMAAFYNDKVALYQNFTSDYIKRDIQYFSNGQTCRSFSSSTGSQGEPILTPATSSAPTINKHIRRPERGNLSFRVNIQYRDKKISFITVPADASVSEITYELKVLNSNANPILFYNMNPIKGLLSNLEARHINIATYPTLYDAIVNHINNPDTIITISDLASLLYAMPTTPGKLLSALNQRLGAILESNTADSMIRISPHQKSIMMNGMRSITGKHPAELQLLDLMKDVVIRTSDIWSAQAISFALNGLQVLRVPNESQLAYTMALAQSIHAYLDTHADVKFSRSQISHAILGLKSLKLSAERDEMLKVVHRMIMARIASSADKSNAYIVQNIEGFRFFRLKPSKKNPAEEMLLTSWCDMIEESSYEHILSPPLHTLRMIGDNFPHMDISPNNLLWQRYLVIITRLLQKAPKIVINDASAISMIIYAFKPMHGSIPAEFDYIQTILSFLQPVAVNDTQLLHMVAGLHSMRWNTPQHNQLLEFIIDCMALSNSSASYDTSSPSIYSNLHLLKTYHRIYHRQHVYEPVSVAMNICCDTLFRYQPSELGLRYLSALTQSISHIFRGHKVDSVYLPSIIRAFINLTGKHDAEKEFLALMSSSVINNWKKDVIVYKLFTADLMHMVSGLQSLHHVSDDPVFAPLYDLAIYAVANNIAADPIKLARMISITESLSTGKALKCNQRNARALFKACINRGQQHIDALAPQFIHFTKKEYSNVCLSFHVLNIDDVQQEERDYLRMITYIISNPAYFQGEKLAFNAEDWVLLFGRLCRLSHNQSIESIQFFRAIGQNFQHHCTVMVSGMTEEEVYRLLRLVGHYNDAIDVHLSFLKIAYELLGASKDVKLDRVLADTAMDGLKYDTPPKAEFVKLINNLIAT